MQLKGIKGWIAACALLMGAGMAHASDEADTPADADTIAVDKRAMESADFSDTAYVHCGTRRIGGSPSGEAVARRGWPQ